MDALTSEQADAIARIRQVGQEVRAARRVLALARMWRVDVLQAEAAIIAELGPTRVSREIDHIIGEATIREATRNRS